MTVILIGFCLFVLIVGSDGSDMNEKSLCCSNYLSLFHVITDERTQRLLNDADVKREIRKLEKQNRILGEKFNNISHDVPSRNANDSDVEAKFRTLVKQITVLEQKLSAVTSDDNRQVAFSGMLSRKIPRSEFGQIVKFDVVTTNIGNAYNTTSGVFRCPVSGLYLISPRVLGDTKSNVILQTRQNEKLIARSHSGMSGIGHNSGSDTVVIHAERGDAISSKVTGGGSAYLDHFSRFTAALLKAD